MSGEKAEYFRRWGPVGGRDWHTVELLESHGIPAFWSGCLTLTLEGERPAPAREDVVYAVDLGDAVFQHLAARCRSPIERLSHRFPPANAQVRFDRARFLADRHDFDFALPPANPTFHRTLRQALGDSVRRFIAAA
jgi:hypothetical protein